MQRLSFRFNVEDENLALNIFRKYVVTIDRKNHWLKYYFKESKWSKFTMVMFTRIRILIIVSQKSYILNNDIIIVT